MLSFVMITGDVVVAVAGPGGSIWGFGGRAGVSPVLSTMIKNGRAWRRC